MDGLICKRTPSLIYKEIKIYPSNSLSPSDNQDGLVSIMVSSMDLQS